MSTLYQKLGKEQNPSRYNFGFFRIWNQKDDPDEDNLITTATKNQNKIKNLAEMLNEDYKSIKNITKKENKEEETDDDNNKLNKNISENVNKILKDVNKIVSQIRSSQESLSKKNMKSLLKIKNKAIKPEKEENEEQNKSIKKKENEYQKLSSKSSKKKSNHYRFLSDFYRRQINKMLINFEPGKFSGNRKYLRKQNSENNKEIEEKAKLIKEEFFHITSPNFFRKNKKSLHKTFYKEKATNKLKINTNTNINFYSNKNNNSFKKKDFSLPKISNYTTMNFHPINKITNSQKKLNLYNFNQNLLLRKNKMRKFPDKEGRKLELELMEDACKNIINSIEHIDGNENDFYNYYANLNSDERKKENDAIMKERLNTENILLKIKNNNLMKNIGKDMIIKRKKVNEDINNYRRQINYIRDEILQNIEQQESKEYNFII